MIFFGQGKLTYNLRKKTADTSDSVPKKKIKTKRQ